MARVDFYLLPEPDPQARRVFACRLAEKAWKAGHRVFLRVSDASEAAILDDLLWTFRPGSFVSHTLAENYPDDPLVAAVIGTGKAPQPLHELLINLSPAVPQDGQRFERIAEIVTQDEASRAAGRNKYRFYQDQGVTLHLHRMASA